MVGTVAMGVPSLLMRFVLAMTFGIAWSGTSTFIVLATKNSESTLMISLLTTFPLLFLSTAVMPKFLLPPWVQTVATYNPMSYIADALRGLIIPGFDLTTLAYGLLTILVVGAVSLQQKRVRGSLPGRRRGRAERCRPVSPPWTGSCPEPAGPGER